jgi:hypothetical protein
MLKLLHNKLPESKSTKKLVTMKNIKLEDEPSENRSRSMKRIASQKNIPVSNPPPPQNYRYLMR